MSLICGQSPFTFLDREQGQMPNVLCGVRDGALVIHIEIFLPISGSAFNVSKRFRYGKKKS